MEKFNKDKTKYLKLIDTFFKKFYHTKKANSEINWAQLNNILVIDFTGIGDLIMLIPFLKILRKNAPHAKISLCCNPIGENVLGEQNLVDSFIIFDGAKYLNNPKNIIRYKVKIRKKISDINRESFDIALEPRGDFRYIFFMHYMNAKRKISYSYTGGEEFLTDVIKPDQEVKHLIEDKLYFLKSIGCHFDEKDKLPELRLSDNGKEYVNSYLKDKKIQDKTIIGIHPSASFEIRRWDKFPELIKKIAMAEKDIHFLFFTTKGEEKIISSLIKASEECSAPYTIVNEKLQNYVRLISVCDAVVCNDSGAGHIAAAYGLSTIVIFGPAIPEFCRPWGKHVTCISHDFDCKPCRKPYCYKNNPECIRSISAEEVFYALENELNKDAEDYLK